MEKTIEEKRAAVLAECERLCPDKTKSISIGCGYIFFGRIAAIEAWFFAINGHVLVSVHPDAITANWEVMYRLLGLETRDAVAELTKELDRVRAACESMAQLPLLEYATDSEEVAAVKRELQAEQAKSAKLVEALEKVKAFATDEDGDEMDAYDLGFEIGEMVDQTLEAHKKGGNA